MNRLGYLPDLPDERDLDFGALSLSIGSTPSSADVLSSLLGDLILDQSITNSCVAHAIAYATYVCHRKAGNPTPKLLSRLFLYWATRKRHGAENIDGGTYIREAMKALATLGFCPEKDWPFDPGEVNAQPAWNAFRMASDQKMPIGYFRISSIGDQRVEDVRRALANGDPVVFGTEVGEEFVTDTTRRIFDPPESSVGGHAMCLLEYDPISFRGPQSWGRSAHDNGWFALSPEYIASPLTRDLWAFRTVPAFT